MKIVANIIKRVTLSLALIYSFNIVVTSIGINIAVNQFSVGVVSTLGIPGLISMAILRLIIK